MWTADDFSIDRATADALTANEIALTPPLQSKHRGMCYICTTRPTPLLLETIDVKTGDIIASSRHDDCYIPIKIDVNSEYVRISGPFVSQKVFNGAPHRDTRQR